MQTEYTNQYGHLVLEPVTDIMPISQIRAIPEHMFDINTAEQIATITENRGIQISFVNWEGNNEDKLFYVILHDSPSTGAVARVKEIDYRLNIPARDVIEYSRVMEPRMFYGYAGPQEP